MGWCPAGSVQGWGTQESIPAGIIGSKVRSSVLTVGGTSLGMCRWSFETSNSVVQSSFPAHLLPSLVNALCANPPATGTASFCLTRLHLLRLIYSERDRLILDPQTSQRSDFQTHQEKVEEEGVIWDQDSFANSIILKIELNNWKRWSSGGEKAISMACREN